MLDIEFYFRLTRKPKAKKILFRLNLNNNQHSKLAGF